MKPFPFRIRNCLTQLYAKDITPDDKQELDEALQREVSYTVSLLNVSVLYAIILLPFLHNVKANGFVILHNGFFIFAWKHLIVEEFVGHLLHFENIFVPLEPWSREPCA